MMEVVVNLAAILLLQLALAVGLATPADKAVKQTVAVEQAVEQAPAPPAVSARGHEEPEINP